MDELRERLREDAASFDGGFDRDRLATRLGQRRRGRLVRAGAAILLSLAAVGIIVRTAQGDRSTVATIAPISAEQYLDAAFAGELETVSSYVEQAGDIEAVNDDGRSGLILASLRGNTEVISALLDAGAAPDRKGADGEAALHLVARAGRNESATALLAGGADPNLVADSRSGRTPLLIAVERGDVQTARVLLEAGADASFSDADGASALQLAFGRNPEALVPLLLDAGADASAPTPWGTLAEYAVDEGFDDLGALLAEAAATDD